MNNCKKTIGWADYTWNPVVGCTHNCSYCYAKEMNNRFKFIPDWNEPQMFPKRLIEPYKLKKPSTIFVGSMCDMMGEKVPDEWIKTVIRVCNDNPQHKFMWLTKNPKRYSDFDFPHNCWLGMTATTGTELNKADKKFMPYNDSFVSIEPLLGSFENTILPFDLVIVGAQTGRNPVVPKKEWIDSIKHENIFYKNNIKKYMEGL